jgi:hypothetical protein
MNDGGLTCENIGVSVLVSVVVLHGADEVAEVSVVMGFGLNQLSRIGFRQILHGFLMMHLHSSTQDSH